MLNSDGKPVVYFIADIHMKDSSELRAGFGSEWHTGKGTMFPWLIARNEKAVLLITGDGLINTNRNSKGILIRDGRMYQSTNAEDTLAIYPDMTMRIFQTWETRAGILQDDGVENAYSFGPTLIRDGVINGALDYSHLNRVNARVGIGYIEPGHYIAIVVERWDNEYSVGMTLTEFAELFAQSDCELAYNLVGGWSSAMVFMGDQLNGHIIQEAGEKGYGTGQRPISDGLMFGYSELVPDAES
jgi:exopolysaccharide biosynthesis protein